jgi:hypothetical protein
VHPAAHAFSCAHAHGAGAQMLDAPCALHSASLVHATGGVWQIPHAAGTPGWTHSSCGALQSVVCRHLAPALDPPELVTEPVVPPAPLDPPPAPPEPPAHPPSAATATAITSPVVHVHVRMRTSAREDARRLAPASTLEPGRSVRRALEQLDHVEHQRPGQAQVMVPVHELALSPKTVLSHRENLMHKIGVTSVVALARFALSAGLAEL